MTTNEVFRKIKEMSRRTVNPRPVIAVRALAEEMQQAGSMLMPFLTELKELRLIKFNEPAVATIKLTLLGATVDRQRQ